MMRTTIATFFLAGAAYAQQNAFNIPDGGYSGVSAGQPLNLSWQPSTGGTVTLVLRSGDSTNLQEGTEIISNAPNNGAFTWNVPSDLTKGFTYTVQIIDSHGNINYTPYFAIDSTNTQPSATAVVATGAPSGSAAKPPVPESLAAQQSSATSAARTADTASMSMSGAASSMMSAGASTTNPASSITAAASSAATSAAASASTTGGAVAVKVSGGFLAGLAGFVAWVL